MPDKEAIDERMSMMSQLRTTVSQLEEAVKDRDGTIETLQRQIVQSEIRDKIRQAQIEIDRGKSELKASDRLAAERMNDAVKEVKKTAKEATKPKPA